MLKKKTPFVKTDILSSLWPEYRKEEEKTD